MRILSAHSLAWPSASRDVSLHPLEHGGVLFDAIGQKLYGVNATAAFIWSCIEEELPPEDTIDRMAELLGVSRDDAEDYTDEIVGRWRELGLIGDPTGAIRRLLAERSPEAAPPRAQRRARAPSDAARKHAAATRHFRLLDMRFCVRFGSEALLRQVEPFLAPLTAAPSKAERVLGIRIGRGGIALDVDGVERDRCLDGSEVVPMLKANLVPLALERSRDFCALHAAAVGRNGACVLMPGAAGRGKSTMAAALVANRLELLSDDTVVLARDRLEARALPLAIGVKTGSWELLARYFPALDAETIHHRPDGKLVRYLLPPPGSMSRDPDARHAVRAIVFLQRTPGGGAELGPISATHALASLSKDFLRLGARLDRPGVERFVRWIAGIECFELRYATLEAGASLILSLLP